MNTYAYVGANPLSIADPRGLAAPLIPLGWAAIAKASAIGGSVGAAGGLASSILTQQDPVSGMVFGAIQGVAIGLTPWTGAAGAYIGAGIAGYVNLVQQGWDRKNECMPNIPAAFGAAVGGAFGGSIGRPLGAITGAAASRAFSGIGGTGREVVEQFPGAAAGVITETVGTNRGQRERAGLPLCTCQ